MSQVSWTVIEVLTAGRTHLVKTITESNMKKVYEELADT